MKILILLIFNLLIFNSLFAQIEDTTVYRVVQQMPIIIDCADANQNWQQQQACHNNKILNFSPKYPKNDSWRMRNNLNAKVIVYFIVEKDGAISNLKVVKGVDDILDAEALHWVQEFVSTYQFRAGFQNGQFVRVGYNLPIQFRTR
jgi:outer membrane biosynthesis protein TonB